MVEDNHSLMGGSGDVFTVPGIAWLLMERSSLALFEGNWMLMLLSHAVGPAVAIFVHCRLHLFIVFVPHLPIL